MLAELMSCVGVVAMVGVPVLMDVSRSMSSCSGASSFFSISSNSWKEKIK